MHLEPFALRRLAIFSAVVALLVPAPAAAKGFERLVVVGATGDSVALRSPPGLADSLFDGANRFNRGHVVRMMPPRGPYIRIYPLGDGGHVGIPGRFYPRTAAVCLSWVQGGRPGQPCQLPNPTLLAALRRAAASLRPFAGPGPALDGLAAPTLRPTVLGNLRVAIELAFDRRARAVAASRPARCLSMRATWRDDGRRRPRAFCLARSGVYARGLLYKLGPSPWELAWHNRR